MMSPTARVALPVPFLKTYTYVIPPALVPLCRPGMRVVVPFGRQSIPGLVVDLETDAPAGIALRPISEVLDDAPVLDRELLEFSRWISDYYFAPWGRVIQAALPASLRTRRTRKLALTPTGREVLENPFAPVRPAERQLLDLLAREGPLKESRLRARLPRATATLRRSLCRKGWAAPVEERLRPEVADRVEEFVRFPSAPPRTHPPVRGKGQRRILEYLTREAHPIEAARLLRQTRASRASLLSLSRAGRVVLESQRVDRVPPGLRPGPGAAALRLTSHQAEASAAIGASLGSGAFGVFLLEGVTGSGKTEVYLAAAARTLETGLGVLYLVPEISLTPLLARRLSARFPGQIALLHSGLSEGERRDQWKRIREGRASLILGTRSAVFAPHPRIGLVIVDEEQDPSYVQTESPRYNGRDAALVRAQRLKATVVLGSATPSVESVAAVRRGKFRHLILPERVEARPMPEVRLVDMREEFRATGVVSLLSRELAAAIREVREAGEQALILLNRRGYATFLLCRACGKILECPRCNIALTYHLSEAELRCHYCAYGRRLPTHCPQCHSPHLHQGGAGTERLEEAIRILDPRLRIARMDRDTVRGRGHLAILERFERGEIDLLLGTQMVAKGHDFPGVTLVGVLSADAYLALPDFRAAERTYQIITQVAGRAGRGSRAGRVLVQAFATRHYALQAAVQGAPSRFYDRELRLRKLMRYPPWVALTQILNRDRNAERGRADARRVASRLRALSEGRFEVLGPALSPLSRIRGEYRYQILVKGEKRSTMASAISALLGELEDSGRPLRNLTIETDPVSLL